MVLMERKEAHNVVLCGELTCALNSPPKPPGVIPNDTPRTLVPDELQRLKDALDQEQSLEKEVLHFASYLVVLQASCRPQAAQEQS